MRDERAAEASDFPPHLDEAREHLVTDRRLARHRLGVDLLEVLLERLERVEVARQRPLEKVRQEAEAVEHPDRPRSFRELPEAIHDLDGLVVNGDEPPLRDQAVDPDRLPLVGETDHRHVQIAAVIGESRFRLLALEVLRGARFETEGIHEMRDIVFVPLLEVDPENRRTPDLRKRVGPVVDLVDTITIEEERRRHSDRDTPFAARLSQGVREHGEADHERRQDGDDTGDRSQRCKRCPSRTPGRELLAGGSVFRDVLLGGIALHLLTHVREVPGQGLLETRSGEEGLVALAPLAVRHGAPEELVEHGARRLRFLVGDEADGCDTWSGSSRNP